MGVAVNIETQTAGKKMAFAEKINHKQPTYYNPVSTRIQDPDDVKAALEATEAAASATYTAEEAIAYNATLPGAMPVGDLTEEQANTYNAWWSQQPGGVNGTAKSDKTSGTTPKAYKL